MGNKLKATYTCLFNIYCFNGNSSVYWRDLIKIKSTSQDKRHFVIITVIVKVFIHCTFFLRMLGQDSRLFSKGLLKIIKNRNYDDLRPRK